MSKSKRVLVTGAGGPGGVNVTRALRLADEEIFLLGTDSNRYHICLAETDARELVPKAADLEAYLERLQTLIHDYNIGLLILTNGVEIRALAGREDDLSARIFLPKPETVATGQDKYRSFEMWAANGIPVPRTFVIRAAEDIDRVFDEIDTRPIWVRGSGIPGHGIGVASLPCAEPDHAKAWIAHHAGWGSFIASEFLPGDNLTWLSLWNQGELVCSQSRRRDSYVIPHVSPSGITGAPAVSHTIHRQDVNDIGRRALKVIDDSPHGVFFIDFKCDASDEPRITEVNVGRFGTTSPHFYAKAGFNIVHLLVKLAYKEDVGAVAQYDVLSPDLYWIRTLDCGPVLIPADEIPKWPT